MKTIFIGNEFLDSDIKEDIINPYNNELLKTISLANSKQVDLALIMSQRAYMLTKNEASYIRRKRLLQLALEIATQKEEFAKLIVDESGKPMRLAKGEVERALITLKLAAEETTRINGEYLDIEIDENITNSKAITKYEAIGTVYAISPFNFPLNLMIHKLAPALAIGNPVIIKPPKQAPLTALKLAEIIQHLHFPKGLVQIIPSDNDMAKKIIESDIIKMVSFTGSDEVGDIISRLAYNKKVVLELGGIATMIVDKTANLKLAANRAAVGAFAYSGQICISVQRVAVHKDVYEEFRKYLIEETNKIKVGNPNKDGVLVGPMIDKVGFDKFNRFYHDAVVKKSEIVIEPIIDKEKMVISPAIVESDDYNLLLNKEEAFAPIMLLRQYSDFEEVLNWTNNTKYGLQASIFSDSLKNINKAIDTLDFGGIIVNDYPTFRVDNQPYGGVKLSGRGREGLKYAIRDMAEIKTVIFRNLK